MKQVTRDTLFEGRLVIYQEKGGYRFSVDSIILAGLTESSPRDVAVDLGTGCGVVALILAYRKKVKHITGVEIQKELVELAKRNVIENKMEGVVEILELDIKEIPKVFESGRFDLVVTNPPYRSLWSGRINPNSQKAIARHELKVNLEDIMRASNHLLKNGGRLSIIYSARRLDFLTVTANKWHFYPKKMTFVHSNMNSMAELVHVIFRKGGGQELTVNAPLFIYETGSKNYTHQMLSLYEG